ncbi:Aldolase-type TIM barrel [Penicillium frequentans]|nr:Aldolase-type TIM barrel [Penicillium glabrum]
MGPDMKSSLELPCGLVLPNRLVKASMAEGLAENKHLPGERISRVYGEWAKGGWGALLTGNVQVDVRHLGGGGDLATRESHLADEEALNAWRQYANACQQHGTPAIAQICHPGRQSPRGAGERGLFEKPIAPSAIPLDIGKGWAAATVRNVAFGVPRAMKHFDINLVTAKFVNSQFLSEQSNTRDDQYGGDATRRARIILDIIYQIRKAVPKTFCVGIKLNSADSSSAQFEDTMTQIGLFVDAGVDFLEISGGSYEDPTMMGRGLREESNNPESLKKESREAFFLDFATQARKRFPDQILMLTGGFRTRKGIESALKAGVCDLIGIGRPAVLNVDFPRLMIDDAVYTDQQARVVFPKVQVPFLARLLNIKMLGGGAETVSRFWQFFVFTRF